MPDLQPLAEGVYGATKLFHPARNLYTNAGFIVIGRNIVHIDAGMTTKDGEWLLSQSMKIAAVKNPKLWLILTHHHSDHIFGMRPFKEAGARIVAHEDLRKFLSKRMPPFFKTGINTTKSYVIKFMVERFSYTKENAEKMLEGVKLFLPDETFTDEKTLQLDGDELLLLHTPGHASSEISVYHHTSKTLFAGDTVYEGRILTTRFGGLREWKQWIRSLEKLELMEIDRIVPGHGIICEKSEIRKNIEYLKKLSKRR
ncbi:MBL fold metallo-hydrolase [Candidatus Bathyarchaeota archaeon]|nr:MBL fold metallo-hydrolase [Candidatus Bathyarchaeota archaeon]